MACKQCGGSGITTSVVYTPDGEKEPWPEQCACTEVCGFCAGSNLVARVVDGTSVDAPCSYHPPDEQVQTALETLLKYSENYANKPKRIQKEQLQAAIAVCKEFLTNLGEYNERAN